MGTVIAESQFPTASLLFNGAEPGGLSTGLHLI